MSYIEYIVNHVNHTPCGCFSEKKISDGLKMIPKTVKRGKPLIDNRPDSEKVRYCSQVPLPALVRRFCFDLSWSRISYLNHQYICCNTTWLIYQDKLRPIPLLGNPHINFDSAYETKILHIIQTEKLDVRMQDFFYLLKYGNVQCILDRMEFIITIINLASKHINSKYIECFNYFEKNDKIYSKFRELRKIKNLKFTYYYTNFTDKYACENNSCDWCIAAKLKKDAKKRTLKLARAIKKKNLKFAKNYLKLIKKIKKNDLKLEMALKRTAVKN